MLVVSCSLFEYHPYETNVSDKNRNVNAKAIERILSSVPPSKDTLVIIHTGDSQRFYDEVEDFVKSANKQNADFVFLAGDISDFGLKDEFEWIHEIMRKLKIPYLGVIGNHDLSGNGETVFKKVYGPLNSSFIVNRFKFILLNTNSREYRFNGRVPDIHWLEEQLDDDDFDRAIVVSHISPFDGSFDRKLEQGYVTALENSGKVNLSLHAHQHKFNDTIPYHDNIRYLISTAMQERMYLLIKLYGDKYSYEKIYY
ncbi:metallophosphoesterase [Fulvivirgaceae bacterium PWU20]|uniref:Metallophosphoesterase n=2 Tax=Chryseosolibacter indicus TaxID=2782351 RepID=A0ABS5VXC8_9BACT|nr:metallophosphoesterase [Chryseosolibacter indicus]